MKPVVNPVNHYIKRLLKFETSAIPTSLVNDIHELTYHKAVFVLNVKCQDGFVVIKRGKRKGSKAKIKYFIQYGTVRCN